MLADSFIIARGLIAKEHFSKGSAGSTATGYPGGVCGLFYTSLEVQGQSSIGGSDC